MVSVWRQLGLARLQMRDGASGTPSVRLARRDSDAAASCKGAFEGNSGNQAVE
jgi:hypothetical protein